MCIDKRKHELLFLRTEVKLSCSVASGAPDNCAGCVYGHTHIVARDIILLLALAHI